MFRFLAAILSVSRPIGICCLLLGTSPLVAQETGRPNIIVLLADDLGYNGLGCYGSDLYRTPNIDRLATQGVRFTDAYSACTVCSPTRASVMTGQYPARLHLTDFIAGQNRPFEPVLPPKWTKFLPHETKTIAEVFRDAGYHTAQVGKWHLNPRGDSNREFEPTDHGFDIQVLKPAAKGYFLRKSTRQGIAEGDYLTDHLTDRAVEIIEKWDDEPFLMYFAYHVPHTPIQAPADLVEHYRKVLKSRGDEAAVHTNAVYAAMVHKLDESVGRILEQLEKSKIADRTVVWFTSDNGGLTHRYGPETGFTDNSPLRRGKGSAYEGGIRVPLIVRWPGHIPANTVCREPVSTIDILPTAAEIVRIKSATPTDGVSLLPVLRNPQSELSRSELYWHYPHYHAGGDGPHGIVRSGNWKLIERYDGQPTELYNLEDDLAELQDQADAKPEIKSRLSKLLADWRNDVGAQMPLANPNADPQKARSTVERNLRKLQRESASPKP